LDIPKHFLNVELGEFIVMPNHLHGIINIVGDADLRPLQDRSKMSLSKIIHGFKSSVSRSVNRIDSRINFAWQRSFYDHVIRADESLVKISEYIIGNPGNWERDENYS
jgi:REP element-mobilizing transposase RayT